MYTEAERESIIAYGATELNSSGRCMPFDALMFWVGLGILLAHKCTIKATHDKITAWLPEKPLDAIDTRALERTGTWVVDDKFPTESWISFYPGG